jgi:hypothetical protein
MDPTSIDELEWENLKLNSLLEEVQAIRNAVKPLKKLTTDPIQKYHDLLHAPKFADLMNRYQSSPMKPIVIKHRDLHRLADPLGKIKSNRDSSVERKINKPTNTFLTETKQPLYSHQTR